VVFSRQSIGFAKETAFNVPHVLQSPTAIFEGLKQEEDEDPRGEGWLCYCGLPPHSYSESGAEVPPWRGHVYLVFVNREWVAYNWRWEKSDSMSPMLPIKHGERFKKSLL